MLLDERVFPALGILKVGAVLENAGYAVDHLDLCGVANYEDVVRDYDKASVFCITSTTPQFPTAMKIVSVLRERPDPVWIVIGGPHATLVHASTRKGNERAKKSLAFLVEHFDAVVAGDGEKAIFTALHQRGVTDADNPRGILWNTSKEFEESPFPARHLIDLSSYHYKIDEVPSTSLIAQLGCPEGCRFCGGRNSPMLRQIRVRSSESVISEMMELHNSYGISGIMHFQDELNINHRSVVDLMRKIPETRIPWKQRGFVKAELFNEEQAELMYAAGFRWLLCGFESGDPKILRNIRKNATREDNARMLRIAHKYGIKVKALMSLGHPGESEETILATRDWILEEQPDEIDFTVMTLYPGTPYFDESVHVADSTYVYETFGDKLYSQDVDFSHEQAYYKGKSGEYHSFVWTDYLSPERLAQLRDDVEAEVRRKLDIPYPTAAPALNYEHSTGMTPSPHIFRSSQ